MPRGLVLRRGQGAASEIAADGGAGKANPERPSVPLFRQPFYGSNNNDAGVFVLSIMGAVDLTLVGILVVTAVVDVFACWLVHDGCSRFDSRGYCHSSS